DDINWMRSITKLPIVLKGVIRGDDAAKAVEAGVDGIIVSSHGGRQLDGVPAPLDALVEIVDEVRGRIPVFMDGGVRCGEDVIKAIALGARLVFLGRAWLWPLAVQGEDGVNKVMDLLHGEILATMKKYGYSNVHSISRNDI
uniref:FMN hydroxy acid dehydrogenase domain-containing protein n=1 Tax=Ciona savignyi TaxID=51511 RepID=H2Z8E6_CIOSA